MPALRPSLHARWQRLRPLVRSEGMQPAPAATPRSSPLLRRCPTTSLAPHTAAAAPPPLRSKDPRCSQCAPGRPGRCEDCDPFEPDFQRRVRLNAKAGRCERCRDRHCMSCFSSARRCDLCELGWVVTADGKGCMRWCVGRGGAVGGGSARASRPLCWIPLLPGNVTSLLPVSSCCSKVRHCQDCMPGNARRCSNCMWHNGRALGVDRATGQCVACDAHVPNW